MAEHCRQPGTWLATLVRGCVAIDERNHKAVLHARWHRDQGYGRKATGGKCHNFAYGQASFVSLWSSYTRTDNDESPRAIHDRWSAVPIQSRGSLRNQQSKNALGNEQGCRGSDHLHLRLRPSRPN